MFAAQARIIAPDDIAVLEKLGWSYSRAALHAEAIGIFENLAQREPQKAKSPYMVGYQYYDQKRWREAINWFDQALELWDAYIVVLYRKGYAHSQLDEVDIAKETLEKCIAAWRNLNGEDSEREAKYYSDACFQLGKLLLSMGQTRNAEKILSESVRYGPPDAYKHYNLGKALLANGKPSEALEQFQNADQIEHNKEYILDYTARAYMALEEYQKAKITLERIPLRNRKAYVWSHIGQIHLRDGQTKKAIDALDRACKSDSDNHNFCYLLGQAYEADGDSQSAYQCYTRAVASRKENYGREFPEAQSKLAVLEKVLSCERNHAEFAQ